MGYTISNAVLSGGWCVGAINLCLWLNLLVAVVVVVVFLVLGAALVAVVDPSPDPS